MKTITLIGPFTDEDVGLLMEAMRVCERKQPDENFAMMVEDNNDTRPLSDIKQLIKDKFPAVVGVPVDIETYTREPTPS